jgi:hypothetical protein
MPARTILSFDGGGVRGAISVAFLERLEDLIVPAGEPAASRIDLVGGTSTGAIIAGALALGYSARDIKDFYLRLAPRVFRRSGIRLPGLQSVFDAGPLTEEIVRICGDRTLETPDLITSFALVMKRMDTGSAWIVSNNPSARYWDDPPDASYVGNRHFLLANLIRASTAAPHYFAPEPIEIVAGQPPGLFVDGGVTPHNNPALALLQLATIPAHGFAWETGADRLRIISIGTGRYRPTLDARRAARMTAAGLAVKALAGMITDGETQVLTTMQLLGSTRTPWIINSEIGDLAGVALTPEPLFEFLRYDVMLEADWLDRELGISVPPADLDRLRQMENPSIVRLAYEIGQAAAARFVKAEHFAAPQAAQRGA